MPTNVEALDLDAATTSTGVTNDRTSCYCIRRTSGRGRQSRRARQASHRISRESHRCVVFWPLVAFSSALLTLGLISFFTSSEFNSDSLLLFGILMILAVASLATGLSAMRTRFSVCENGVACSSLFGEQTFHFTQIAKMSVSRSPLANLRRPFNALKPQLVIETMGSQSATYRICPFLISDFTIFDAAVDRWKVVAGDAEPVSTDD